MARQASREANNPPSGRARNRRSGAKTRSFREGEPPGDAAVVGRG